MHFHCLLTTQVGQAAWQKPHCVRTLSKAYAAIVQAGHGNTGKAESRLITLSTFGVSFEQQLDHVLLPTSVYLVSSSSAVN
jgi:hypothetical protein